MHISGSVYFPFFYLQGNLNEVLTEHLKIFLSLCKLVSIQIKLIFVNVKTMQMKATHSSENLTSIPYCKWEMKMPREKEQLIRFLFLHSAVSRHNKNQSSCCQEKKNSFSFIKTHMAFHPIKATPQGLQMPMATSHTDRCIVGSILILCFTLKSESHLLEDVNLKRTDR